MNTYTHNFHVNFIALKENQIILPEEETTTTTLILRENGWRRRWRRMEGEETTTESKEHLKSCAWGGKKMIRILLIFYSQLKFVFLSRAKHCSSTKMMLILLFLAHSSSPSFVSCFLFNYSILYFLESISSFLRR